MINRVIMKKNNGYATQNVSDFYSFLAFSMAPKPHRSKRLQVHNVAMSLRFQKVSLNPILRPHLEEVYLIPSVFSVAVMLLDKYVLKQIAAD